MSKKKQKKKESLPRLIIESLIATGALLTGIANLIEALE